MLRFDVDNCDDRDGRCSLKAALLAAPTDHDGVEGRWCWKEGIIVEAATDYCN